MSDTATPEEIKRAVALMQLGAETAKVVLAELDRMDVTQGELLITLEEFVVQMICGIDISTGKEGRLLANLRTNVMRRTAKARLLMDGKVAGNG